MSGVEVDGEIETERGRETEIEMERGRERERDHIARGGHI